LSDIRGVRPPIVKPVCLIVGFLLMLAGSSAASTLSVLNMDFLGRGGGTGGLAARPGDPDNVFWNASALAFGEGTSAFAGYMDYLVGVRGGTVGFGGMAWEDYGYGLWVSYVSSGDLVETGFDDPVGGRGETFRYSEFMTGLAAGTALLPYLSVGGGVKLARQDLDDFSVSGLFGDLSVTFKAYSPDTGMRSRPRIYTSYIVRNIEVARWGDDESDVAGNSEIGMAMEFPGSGVISGFSFHFGGNGRREIRWGLEVDLSRDFELRLGYRRRTGLVSDHANDLPWERGLLVGFGLGFGPVRLDYAFEDASPLDNIHRFSVRSAPAGDKRN